MEVSNPSSQQALPWGLTPQCEETNTLARLHWDNHLVPPCGDSTWLRMASKTRAMASPPEIPTWPMNVFLAGASLRGDHAERSHWAGWCCLRGSSTSSWTLLVACRCSWGVWCIPAATPDTESVSCASYKNQSKSIKCPPSSHSACRGSKAGPITLKMDLSGVRWE